MLGRFHRHERKSFRDRGRTRNASQSEMDFKLSRHLDSSFVARASFKSNPRAEAKKAGLSDDQSTALENLDWIGLEMAARSFAKKSPVKTPANLVRCHQGPPVASSFPALSPL